MSECCSVCNVCSTKEVILTKCAFPDNDIITASDCPNQNKILELTINLPNLCPKSTTGGFTRLAVCVTISKAYQGTTPTVFDPYACQTKIVELPTFGEPCGSELTVDFCFCLEEPLCSDKKIEVKVGAHYVC